MYRDIPRIIQINIDSYDLFGENKLIYKSVLMEEELHVKYPENNNEIYII